MTIAMLRPLQTEDGCAAEDETLTTAAAWLSQISLRIGDRARHDGTDLESDAYAMVQGLSAAMMALVETLEESGFTTKSAFRRNLFAVWHEMDEGAAAGEAGGVIETLLEGLDEPAADNA